MPKREVDKYILAPEIKQYADFQVFELRGKDARGCDFGVRLSPLAALPLMNEPVAAADADRVNMYAGGTPATIGNLETKVEITMGTEKEVHTIDSAAMTYVPKGVPYGHRVTGGTDKMAWVLTLTLPPRYDPPKQPA